MLRLFVPPNLPAAATRDAIAVKIELDLSAPPAPHWLPALAQLQRLGAQPAPVLFLQFTRAQLREFLGHLRGQPVVARLDAPTRALPWLGPILRGVSEHLAEATSPAALASPPPAAAAPPRHGATAARPRPRTEDLTPLVVDGSPQFLALTLPSRESLLYAAALDFVKSHDFQLEPSNRKWWLRDRHKVLNLLARHGRTLREEFHAEFTPNFECNTAGLKWAAITAEARPQAEGFELTLGLDAGTAAPTAVQAAIAAGRAYLETDQGLYLIDAARLEGLATAERLLSDNPSAGLTARRTHRVSAARVAEVQDVLDELAPHFAPPAAWLERCEALRDLTTLPPARVAAHLDPVLRPYQRLGVAWMAYLHRHDLGGILADEMGLGKTLQALALFTALRASDLSSAPRPTFLVVCPASLVENWRREALRFTPSFRVFTHHREQRLARPEEFATHDLIITSYATLARDESLFARVRFTCVIADEAQHIKNRRTRNAQALRQLVADGRFLLTGTPLENSLEDLRSLFAFLMPGYLAPLPVGLRGEERAWHDDRLRSRTARYILRRTKAAVAPELPPKLEQVLYCDLEPAQAALYRRTQEAGERTLLDLETRGASEQAQRFAALTQLLRLRQICCDPRLVDSAAAEASGKLNAFRELLDEALDEGHRVLVFSQFTSLLALLREELDATGVAYAYLDGAMSPRARQAEVDRFQAAGDELPVFLLSLKAGGTGLNLTAADTVLHFDPWWNPAVEAQATDRAHRIGQDRVVTAYKLICSGTVEEKVLALQDNKRALLADVFEASDAAAARLDLDDLRDLLRFGSA
jgi:superfamily II DNA or RNA helicase